MSLKDLKKIGRVFIKGLRQHCLTNRQEITASAIQTFEYDEYSLHEYTALVFFSLLSIFQSSKLRFFVLFIFLYFCLDFLSSRFSSFPVYHAWCEFYFSLLGWVLFFMFYFESLVLLCLALSFISSPVFVLSVCTCVSFPAFFTSLIHLSCINNSVLPLGFCLSICVLCALFGLTSCKHLVSCLVPFLGCIWVLTLWISGHTE